MTGSRSLNGLDLNNVLESGRGRSRSSRSTRSSTLPTIIEEPEIPTVAQKDAQEIKQRLLNMYISSLGDMSEDEKKAKIAFWLLHFDKEQQPDSKGEEEEEKQDTEDTEDKEQQPDSKGEAKEEKQPTETEEKEEEEKQPPEEKNDDPQAKQPDNTAEEDMGEDEQREKKPSVEESSPMEDTSSTPAEDPDPKQADVSSSDDSLSNHGSEPDFDTDGMDDSVSLGSTSSYQSDDDTVSSEDTFAQKQKEKQERQKRKAAAAETKKAAAAEKKKTKTKKNGKKKNNKASDKDGEKPKKRAPQVKRPPGTAAYKVKHQLDHQVREALFGVVNPMKTTQNMSTPFMCTDEYQFPAKWTEKEAAAYKTETSFPKVKFGVFCYTEQQPNANGGGGESGGVLGFSRFHFWTGSSVSSNALAPVLQPLEATCHPALHDTCEDFHHSVFGLTPIHRSRQRKVVKLLAREGHPALIGKRACYATKSDQKKSDRHLPTTKYTLQMII